EGRAPAEERRRAGRERVEPYEAHRDPDQYEEREAIAEQVAFGETDEAPVRAHRRGNRTDRATRSIPGTLRHEDVRRPHRMPLAVAPNGALQLAGIDRLTEKVADPGRRRPGSVLCPCPRGKNHDGDGGELGVRPHA